MKKLLVILFLFSKVFSQELTHNLLLDEILGTYKYSKAGSLSYDEWDMKRQEKSLRIVDYNKDDYSKIKLIIKKKKSIFYENQYFIDIYINKKLIHSHYVNIVYKRDDGYTYDILTGDTILTIDNSLNTLVVYYKFNHVTDLFKKVFVFYN
jgi:hypothetical protein